MGVVADDRCSLECAAGMDDVYIILCNDIDLSEDVVVTGKNVTLDLNGHKIFNTNDIWDVTDSTWALLTVKGEITITGDGELIAKDNDCYAVTVVDGGKCTIKSGRYVGNIHTVYVYNGTLEVYGGSFSVVQKYSAAHPDDYVLNCYDAAYGSGAAKITVYGGKFYGFNPENCYAEGANTNFLAAGRAVTTATEEGVTVYTVIDENDGTPSEQSGSESSQSAENSASAVEGQSAEESQSANSPSNGGSQSAQNSASDGGDASAIEGSAASSGNVNP